MRAAAIARLGDAGSVYERLDRWVGIANVVAAVLCVPAILTFGFTVQM